MLLNVVHFAFPWLVSEMPESHARSAHTVCIIHTHIGSALYVEISYSSCYKYCRNIFTTMLPTWQFPGTLLMYVYMIYMFIYRYVNKIMSAEI